MVLARASRSKRGACGTGLSCLWRDRTQRRLLALGPAEAYPDAIKRLGHQIAKEVLQVLCESRSFLRHILAEEEIVCDRRESSHLTLALNATQQHALSQHGTMLQADGVATHLLERDSVQQRIGTSLGPAIVDGLFIPEKE